MLPYFLIPYEPSQWQTAHSDLVIEPQLYQKAMQKQWPQVRVLNNVRIYLLWWEIHKGDYQFTGGLQSSKQIVSLTPSSGKCLNNFVLWHRQFVGRQTALFLTWEGTWDSLEIKADTTPAEISAFTGLID
jgi:hypothetical protein